MVAATKKPGRDQFTGIYDPPEAVRYLRASNAANETFRLSSAKLRRWIRRGLVSTDLADVAGHDLLIGFEDLISMRVITTLRMAGVGWSEIRLTNRWLRDDMGVERPFASELLWVGQGRLFSEWTRQLISASRHGQMALDILWQYLIPVHGLTFDETSGLASSWEPHDGVVLEPGIQFGAPCIKGTRIPTRTVAGMIGAGDSLTWVADAYDLSLHEVQAACDWESRLNA